MTATSRPLHYVTGKGGVGKSTVCAALALAAAARGERVLAIELGEPGGLRRMLGLGRGAAGVIEASSRAAGVATAWFEGAAALAEYLVLRKRLGRLGRVVLAHPLYRAFAAAAPGLRELMVIGKVRDELVLQRDGARPRWDRVIVDAGASGQALGHLRMPVAATRGFGDGLVQREAAKNAALLADRERCAVHVVALPEEMPLAEAQHVFGALHGLGISAGALFVNQCRPTAPRDAAAAIARLAARDPGPARRSAHDEVVATLRRAWRWQDAQEAAIAARERAMGLIAVRLPRVWRGDALARAAALAPAVEVAALVPSVETAA